MLSKDSLEGTSAEADGVHEPMWSVAFRHGVIESLAEGDFDALDRVEDQEAKVAIKFIEIGEKLEPGAGLEMIGENPI